jgi:hypothetical protein
MVGRFGMGTRDKPDYLDFTATQVLAMPAGFAWKMRARRGLMRLSGSDSQRWTRFWLMGLLPIARLGGDLATSGGAAPARYCLGSLRYRSRTGALRIINNTAVIAVLYEFLKPCSTKKHANG